MSKFVNRIIKTIVTTFFVLIIYISFSLSPSLFYSVSDTSETENYKITAHRGGGGNEFPENSISAIQNTLKNGNVKRVEIDIHQTRDSILIVMHDKKIDRTTTGKGLIKDITYEELSRSVLRDSEGSEKVPTLEEIMKIIDGKLELIIELKYGDSYYPNIEKRTAKMIQKYDAKDWCIIHSFDDRILEQMHNIDNEIQLHKLFFLKFKFLPIIIDNTIRVKKLKDYKNISEFSVCYLFANKGVIDEIHSENKKINVWTVNSKSDKNKLSQIKVDGIISDFP